MSDRRRPGRKPGHSQLPPSIPGHSDEKASENTKGQPSVIPPAILYTPTGVGLEEISLFSSSETLTDWLEQAHGVDWTGWNSEVDPTHFYPLVRLRELAAFLRSKANDLEALAGGAADSSEGA